MVLPPPLIEAIATGRCMALVGSGPSCELGYPSWHNLASRIYAVLTAKGAVDDPESYTKYLAQHKYPELFKQAEYDVGGRANLADIVKAELKPNAPGYGQMYQYLTRWPFACYFTTNYDDEISRHLAKAGVYYTTRLNRQEDLALVRSTIKDVVFKLHGDFTAPSSLVLTSADYDNLVSSPSFEYFRQRVRSVMEMFDMLIVGHSLSDWDLAFVLSCAKHTISRAHPVYMIAADFTKAEVKEYYEKYNIQLIPYSNADGQHSQLRKMLSFADKLISPRSAHSSELPTLHLEEAETAMSLLLFRRLHNLASQGGSVATEYIGPLVMHVLAANPGLTITEIVSHLPGHSDPRTPQERAGHVTQVLNDLVAEQLVEITSERYVLSNQGNAKVHEVAQLRLLQKDQAYGQFVTTLRAHYPTLTAEEEVTVRQAIEASLIQAFKRRGLAIAGIIFANKKQVGQEDASEIFAAVYAASAVVPPGPLRAAFIEAAVDFIARPSGAQKSYLEAVSQGFFLFHMVGLDESWVV